MKNGWRESHKTFKQWRNYKKCTHTAFRLRTYAKLMTAHLLLFYTSICIWSARNWKVKNPKQTPNSNPIAYRPPEHKAILSSLTVRSAVCSNRKWKMLALMLWLKPGVKCYHILNHCGWLLIEDPFKSPWIQLVYYEHYRKELFPNLYYHYHSAMCYTHPHTHTNTHTHAPNLLQPVLKQVISVTG